MTKTNELIEVKCEMCNGHGKDSEVYENEMQETVSREYDCTFCGGSGVELLTPEQVEARKNYKPSEFEGVELPEDVMEILNKM